MNDASRQSDSLAAATPAAAHAARHAPVLRLSQRAQRTGPQPISYLMAEAISNPNLISLAAGLVDYDALPMEATAAMMQQLLSDPQQSRLALQYGTTAGHAGLRRTLLDHLAALDGLTAADLQASAEELVVTTGSQQLLFMLTDVLVDPGDIVITAWPSYFVYTGTLKTFGANVRCVDMDEQGMIPARLEALLEDLAGSGDLSRVKIVYVVSDHQNPTGITLPEDRRRAIFEIVKRYSNHPQAGGRILLIEDAAYRELTYEGDLPQSIKSCDATNEYVALVQTFSKPFAPGVKTGYGLLPRDLVDPVVQQKGNHDFGSSNLNQHLLFMAMRDGLYAQHVTEMRRAYAAKRDALLDALEAHRDELPTGTRWTKPAGGLYVWVTFPPTVNTNADGPLFQRALAEGVIYVPGAYCYCDDVTRTIPKNEMRLSFGVPTVEQIRLGVQRLTRAINAVT